MRLAPLPPTEKVELLASNCCCLSKSGSLVPISQPANSQIFFLCVQGLKHLQTLSKRTKERLPELSLNPITYPQYKRAKAWERRACYQFIRRSGRNDTGARVCMSTVKLSTLLTTQEGWLAHSPLWPGIGNRMK